jgi:excisionase family DNA binding protein
MNFENFPDLMTVQDLKKLFNIGTNKAYEITHYKNFPKIKIGRKIIIPKKQLMQWIENQTIIEINKQINELEQRKKAL